MGRSMAHIAHQPGPVCLESGVSRWLVGVVGLGVELCTSAHTRRVGGALLQFEWRSKTRRPRPSATVAEGLAGIAVPHPLFPGGPGGTKPLLFTTHRPRPNVQEKKRSCARDQVVVARPPVLTPPTHDVIGALLRVRKGRFTTSINQRDLCGNPFKPPEKAISRGDRLCRRPPPPPRQGMIPVVSWIMTRVWIWENIELSVGFRGCCE
jgi:hypothetical protein